MLILALAFVLLVIDVKLWLLRQYGFMPKNLMILLFQKFNI